MHKAKNFNSKETTFREVRENPLAKQENKKRVILKNTKKKNQSKPQWHSEHKKTKINK